MFYVLRDMVVNTNTSLCWESDLTVYTYPQGPTKNGRLWLSFIGLRKKRAQVYWTYKIMALVGYGSGWFYEVWQAIGAERTI